MELKFFNAKNTLTNRRTDWDKNNCSSIYFKIKFKLIRSGGLADQSNN